MIVVVESQHLDASLLSGICALHQDCAGCQISLLDLKIVLISALDLSLFGALEL